MSESVNRRIDASEKPEGFDPIDPVGCMVTPRLPVSHEAVRRIQEMIASGELKPGDSLPSQRDLAANLNVSRPSLREALSVLETLGFIEVSPGRRAVVREPKSAEGSPPRWRFKGRFSEADVFQFRMLVETATARLAATNIKEGQLAELRGNVEAMRRAIRGSDLELSARIDAEFHARIIEASGNMLLPEIYVSTADIILEAHRLPLLARDRLWEPVHEHVDIINALQQRDPEGAGYYMRLHLMRTATRSGLDAKLETIV